MAPDNELLCPDGQRLRRNSCLCPFPGRADWRGGRSRAGPLRRPTPTGGPFPRQPPGNQDVQTAPFPAPLLRHLLPVVPKEFRPGRKEKPSPDSQVATSESPSSLLQTVPATSLLSAKEQVPTHYCHQEDPPQDGGVHSDILTDLGMERRPGSQRPAFP